MRLIAFSYELAAVCSFKIKKKYVIWLLKEICVCLGFQFSLFGGLISIKYSFWVWMCISFFFYFYVYVCPVLFSLPQSHWKVISILASPKDATTVYALKNGDQTVWKPGVEFLKPPSTVGAVTIKQMSSNMRKAIVYIKSNIGRDAKHQHVVKSANHFHRSVRLRPCLQYTGVIRWKPLKCKL